MRYLLGDPNELFCIIISTSGWTCYLFLHIWRVPPGGYQRIVVDILPCKAVSGAIADGITGHNEIYKLQLTLIINDTPSNIKRSELKTLLLVIMLSFLQSFIESDEKKMLSL